MNLPFLSAARRAQGLVADPQHHATSRPHVPAAPRFGGGRAVTGVRFRELDRSTQLRTFFQIESGLGGLSRRHAREFIDTFLTLAAQAYLEPRPW
jgi:hypothetical protein